VTSAALPPSLTAWALFEVSGKVTARRSNPRKLSRRSGIAGPQFLDGRILSGSETPHQVGRYDEAQKLAEAMTLPGNCNQDPVSLQILNFREILFYDKAT